MITKQEYEALQEQHIEGLKQNDYSKMIIVGDHNWERCNAYRQEFVCKHSFIIEVQGGQIEYCKSCGKVWD